MFFCQVRVIFWFVNLQQKVFALAWHSVHVVLKNSDYFGNSFKNAIHLSWWIWYHAVTRYFELALSRRRWKISKFSQVLSDIERCRAFLTRTFKKNIMNTTVKSRKFRRRHNLVKKSYVNLNHINFTKSRFTIQNISLVPTTFFVVFSLRNFYEKSFVM